jgi:MFS transporter, CP family, cyanate transporter
LGRRRGAGDGGKGTLGASRVRALLALAGILLVAANLRAPITSVGPLLGDIRESVSLSAGAAGLLTAGPLLAFAGLSPLAPGLARRFGVERVLFGALVLLAAGVLLRSTYLPGALFAGTLAVGLAIALGNVLLPGLVKRDLPGRTGLVTGLYTATMSSVAALASGVSVPAAGEIGWRGSLAVWVAPAFVSALLWMPRLRAGSSGSSKEGSASRPVVRSGLWRSPLAWQVTAFMGLQSVIFYVSITWLPAILLQEGMGVAQAGWMLSLMQLVAIPAALFAPVLAERAPSQRFALVGAAGLSGAGILGLLLFDGALPWVVLLGLGQGSCISLALTLFALRAPEAGRSAELSGMAQSFGYLLAATGPPLFGLLYDLSGSWAVPLLTLLAVAALLAAFGLGAGRNVRVPAN